MIEYVKNGKIVSCLVVLFFLIYFGVGIWLIRDYGVSTDEPFERKTMHINVNYIMTQLGEEYMEVPELETYEDKYYGMVMQMPTIIFEDLDRETSFVYLCRHFYTFVVCMIGYIAFFCLCKKLFRSNALGILGTIMVSLYPRFFAEQFYNIKDMVFVATFMIAMWATERMITNKFSFKWVILFTLFSAIATNVRIFGGITIALVVAYIWIVCILEKKYQKNFYNMTYRRALLLSLSMIGLYLMLWIALLPGTWERPIHSLIEMFRDFSNYDWNGDIVFMGKVIKKEQLTWYYIPVWMLVSIPIWYIIFLCAFGCAGFKHLIKLLKEKKKILLVLFFKYQYVIWSISLFAIPLCVIIILKATIYNGWRHCYFLLPPLVIFILYGIDFFQKKSKKWKKIMVILLIICGIGTQISWIAINHPYEMVYFNEIGRKYAAGFDRDYWHLAEKQALEYIIQHAEGQKITVDSSGNLLAINILDGNLKNRIEESEEPTYYIETYRGKVGNEFEMVGYEEVHSIIVDNFKVATVFKRVM